MVSRSRSKAGVTGIGGVFLRSRRPSQLAAWYRAHLGVPVEKQVVTYEWVNPRTRSRVGSTLWAVLDDADRDWGPGQPSAMVNYRVRDLQRLLRRLRSEGVRVEGRMRRSSYGRFGWIIDPDGNRIELWEPPKGRYRSSDRHVPME